MKKSALGHFLSGAFLILYLSLPLSVCAQEKRDGLFYYRTTKEKNPSILDCDVAVYGGTPGGVTAAIEAARMGHKAMLLSFNQHVGGMASESNSGLPRKRSPSFSLSSRNRPEDKLKLELLTTFHCSHTARKSAYRHRCPPCDQGRPSRHTNRRRIPAPGVSRSTSEKDHHPHRTLRSSL